MPAPYRTSECRSLRRRRKRDVSPTRGDSTFDGKAIKIASMVDEHTCESFGETVHHRSLMSENSCSAWVEISVRGEKPFSSPRLTSTRLTPGSQLPEIEAPQGLSTPRRRP
jgi:hypothetical protein